MAHVTFGTFHFFLPNYPPIYFQIKQFFIFYFLNLVVFIKNINDYTTNDSSLLTKKILVQLAYNSPYCFLYHFFGINQLESIVRQSAFTKSRNFTFLLQKNMR